MYIYIYIYIYMYIRIYVYIYIYRYLCIHTLIGCIPSPPESSFALKQSAPHILIYIYIYINMYCMYVCIYIYIYIHSHTLIGCIPVAARVFICAQAVRAATSDPPPSRLVLSDAKALGRENTQQTNVTHQ